MLCLIKTPFPWLPQAIQKLETQEFAENDEISENKAKI